MHALTGTNSVMVLCLCPDPIQEPDSQPHKASLGSMSLVPGAWQPIMGEPRSQEYQEWGEYEPRARFSQPESQDDCGTSLPPQARMVMKLTTLWGMDIDHFYAFNYTSKNISGWMDRQIKWKERKKIKKSGTALILVNRRLSWDLQLLWLHACYRSTAVLMCTLDTWAKCLLSQIPGVLRHGIAPALECAPDPRQDVSLGSGNCCQQPV